MFALPIVGWASRRPAGIRSSCSVHWCFRPLAHPSTGRCSPSCASPTPFSPLTLFATILAHLGAALSIAWVARRRLAALTLGRGRGDRSVLVSFLRDTARLAGRRTAIEAELREKLRKIESLFAGAGTAGERVAAEAALRRVQARLAELERADPPGRQMQFSMPDQGSRRLFVALCRRYGLKPYRYRRQRLTTVAPREPRGFADQVLWPEFIELNPAPGRTIVRASGDLPCVIGRTGPRRPAKPYRRRRSASGQTSHAIAAALCAVTARISTFLGRLPFRQGRLVSDW